MMGFWATWLKSAEYDLHKGVFVTDLYIVRRTTIFDVISGTMLDGFVPMWCEEHSLPEFLPGGVPFGQIRCGGGVL